MKEYTFYEDPGHGWLAVPVQELVALGIHKKISQYSYRKGEIAFLEEDCDAGIFIEAKGGIENVPYKTIHQDPTPIRNYPSYYAPQAPEPVKLEQDPEMDWTYCAKNAAKTSRGIGGDQVWADTPAQAHREFKKKFPRVRKVYVAEYQRKKTDPEGLWSSRVSLYNPGPNDCRYWRDLPNDGTGAGLPDTADRTKDTNPQFLGGR